MIDSIVSGVLIKNHMLAHTRGFSGIETLRIPRLKSSTYSEMLSVSVFPPVHFQKAESPCNTLQNGKAINVLAVGLLPGEPATIESIFHSAIFNKNYSKTVTLDTNDSNLDRIRKMFIQKMWHNRSKGSKVSKKSRKKLIQKSIKNDEKYVILKQLSLGTTRNLTNVGLSYLSFPLIIDGKFKGRTDRRCLKCVHYKKLHGRRIVLESNSVPSNTYKKCECQNMVIKSSYLKYG